MNTKLVEKTKPWLHPMNRGAAFHRIKGIQNVLIIFDYSKDVFRIYKNGNQIAECQTATQAKTIARAQS